jgi:signal transduction histidine kinase
MRPPALDELGLVAALRQQVGVIRTPAGSPMHVFVEADELPTLPASVEVAAFRIASEAVTNSARHSGTDQVWLQIRQDHDHLEVSVTIDDPKMYTKPYLVVKQQVYTWAPVQEFEEQLCIPSEALGYRETFRPAGTAK